MSACEFHVAAHQTKDIMNEFEKKLGKDPDGMAIYDYIVNNVGTCCECMPQIVEKLRGVDTSGQFLCSSARYLSAIDRVLFAPWIKELIEGAIEKDRERRYIGSLLEGIWGPDYRDHVDELRKSDDNFRRIYKRIFPSDEILVELSRVPAETTGSIQ